MCLCSQKLSLSSIAPGEDSETRLYIATSLEVRSDEICAESVFSSDDVVLGSKVVIDGAVGDRSPPTVVTKQQDAGTDANNIDVHRPSQTTVSTDYGSSHKSSHATTSVDTVCFQQKMRSTSRQSDAETDTGPSHVCDVQKDVCHPRAVDSSMKQNHFMESASKSASQVCLH